MRVLCELNWSGTESRRPRTRLFIEEAAKNRAARWSLQVIIITISNKDMEQPAM